jgi:hypothetical protein
MSNVCKCPNPPGGQAVCAAGQIAFCEVSRGGVRRTRCASRPRGARSPNQRFNWALEEITGIPRSPDQSVTGAEFKILQSGRYQRSDGTMVNFSLPESMGGTTTASQQPRGRF